MEDSPFGLDRQSTYAKLSAHDLQTMGKQASSLFLCDSIPLNDAVVKLAQEHPSISAEQVKRVVEFANQETFQRCFAKQASDKNVEFPVADPGVVLRSLNDGARPNMRDVPSSDYASDPVKMAHSTVGADIELARVFGYELASPMIEKAASAATMLEDFEKTSAVADRVLPGRIPSDPVDRILMAKQADSIPGGKADDKPSSDFSSKQMAMGKKVEMEHTDNPALAEEISRDHLEEFPDYYTRLGKMEDQAKKEKKAGILYPQPAMGQGQEQPQQDPAQVHHEEMLQMSRKIELAKKQQELINVQQKTQTMADGSGGAGGGGQPPGPEGAPPAGPPQGAQPPLPEAAAPPLPMSKTGAFVKEAMAYIRSDRPNAGLVLQDLRDVVSIDKIKQATVDRNAYPEADPHRELVAMKQKLSRMLSDTKSSLDLNQVMEKEAEDQFHHHAVQYMWNDGNLGELSHAMAGVTSDPTRIKTAMASLVPVLIKKGMDPVLAQVESIHYEMDKTASIRAVNPDNPIVQSFANLLKVAHGTKVLQASLAEIQKMDREVEGVLKEALVRHASAF